MHYRWPPMKGRCERYRTSLNFLRMYRMGTGNRFLPIPPRYQQIGGRLAVDDPKILLM